MPHRSLPLGWVLQINSNLPSSDRNFPKFIKKYPGKGFFPQAACCETQQIAKN